MKKILTSLLFICITLTAHASLPYKNIQKNEKLKFSDNVWSIKVNTATADYFVKSISSGTGNYSEFYKPSGKLAFSTGCQYEFIKNGKLIGYSNPELKFYIFSLSKDKLVKRELTKNEVQELFSDYKIVTISEKKKNTNSINIKKPRGKFKVLLLNDTDEYFYHYSFSSKDAKFKSYPLTGLIDITKGGILQFSHIGGNTNLFPQYALFAK